MGCGKSANKERELKQMIAKQKRQIAELTKMNAEIQKAVVELQGETVAPPSMVMQEQVLQLENKLAVLNQKVLLRHTSTLSRGDSLDLPNRPPAYSPGHSPALTPGAPIISNPEPIIPRKDLWEDPEIKQLLEKRRKQLFEIQPQQPKP